MCGLVGYFTHSGLGSTEVFQAMGNALSHRDPDNLGVWLDKNNGIGMAHQQLADDELGPLRPMVEQSFNPSMLSEQDLLNVAIVNRLHKHFFREIQSSHHWSGVLCVSRNGISLAIGWR